MITITLDRRDYVVGDRVTGHVLWNPSSQSNPRGIIVMAQWRTEGRGDSTSDIVAELRADAGPTGFTPPVQLPFELTLPSDGPISYNGKLIRVIWEIIVRIDLPMALDTRHKEMFYVFPRQLAPDAFG